MSTLNLSKAYSNLLLILPSSLSKDFNSFWSKKKKKLNVKKIIIIIIVITLHLHSSDLSVKDASICLNMEQQACSNFGITVLIKRSLRIASRVGFNEATKDLVNNSVST